MSCLSFADDIIVYDHGTDCDDIIVYDHGTDCDEIYRDVYR